MRRVFPFVVWVGLAGCVHYPAPLAAPPASMAPVSDPEVLPFAAKLDAAFEKKDPALFAELSEMDRAGDRDGVFTRGDAWKAGRPQLFADMHAHVFMADTLGSVYDGRPDSKRLAGKPLTIATTQLTFGSMRRGALNVVVSPIYVPSVIRATRGNRLDDFEEALRQAEAAKAFAKAHPAEMEIALTAADARRIAGAGKIAVILAVEGGHVIRTVKDVDALHAAGVRFLTITHFSDNALAAAAASSGKHPENFNFSGPREPREGGWFANTKGLTPLGRDVVRRMAEVGMLIDIAHASDVAIRDVLAATEDLAVPLIVTHTASRTLHPSERNVSDETVRAVAARGGVVGLTVWRTQLVAAGIDECKAFGAHFRHLLSVAGPEHIALGSDFNGMVQRPLPCEGKTGLRHAGDLPELYQSLVEEGVPPRVIEGMGENVLRALEAAERIASQK